MSKTTIVKCDSCKKRIEDVNPFKFSIHDYFTEQNRYIESSGELCKSCGQKLKNFVLFGDKL
jgi:rRNA maturation protein Nop10